MNNIYFYLKIYRISNHVNDFLPIEKYPNIYDLHKIHSNNCVLEIVSTIQF